VSDPASLHNDVVFIERPPAGRTRVRVEGRYALASRWNERGERREFACHTVEISCDEIVLTGPVAGPVGERIIGVFDELGQLEGQIVRLVEGGFVMRPSLSKDRRKWLADQIDWLDKHAHFNLPNDRTHKRSVPKVPHSTVLLSDGSMRSCLIIDMSVSGAAVSAEISPQLGDVLAVGKVIGRVVRIFPEGFAVRFIELQHPAALERLLLSA